MIRIDGQVVTAASVLSPGTVIVAGEHLAWVGPTKSLPATYAHTTAIHSDYILPGLVDLHCHGGAGYEFASGDAQQARAAAAIHRAGGTTAVVATVGAAPVGDLTAATARLADLAQTGDIAGIHLEGPFLAPARCGAQNPAHFIQADTQVTQQLLAAARGHLVTMTLAPELPGAAALASELAAHGVGIGIGHTDAHAGHIAAFVQALSAGAAAARVRFIHLFNAMRPIHHRDPGPALVGMEYAARGLATIELIADGAHLDPATIRATFHLVGAASICLVTDAIAVAGLGDGDFAGLRVRAGTATLSDAHTLAGGTTRLIDVVRHVHAQGVDLVDAVRAGSQVPALAMGRTDIGALTAGLRADLVLTDTELKPQAVMWRGQWV